jgi:hypothetical protein
MYAYFGVGAVNVPNPSFAGHTFCLMYGNPGDMCGYAYQRMMNGHAWMMG